MKQIIIRILTYLFQNRKTIRPYINKAYNYFKKGHTALDEAVTSGTDYKMWAITASIVPDIDFEFDCDCIPDQNVTGYKRSCTAQGTTTASNIIRKAKSDDTRNSGFELRDIMVDLWLWAEWEWAYIINAIKKAKELWIIDWYYKVSWKYEIEKAIYENTDLIVSWSNKIDYSKLAETWYIVEEVSNWLGHCICIPWFKKDSDRDLYRVMNSYWEDYWIEWGFYIPYDLIEDILFNSTYAVVVNPEWTKMTQEERYKAYQLTK